MDLAYILLQLYQQLTGVIIQLLLRHLCTKKTFGSKNALTSEDVHTCIIYESVTLLGSACHVSFTEAQQNLGPVTRRYKVDSVVKSGKKRRCYATHIQN
jgi:hypothetical protein